MPPRVILAGHNIDREILEDLRSFLVSLAASPEQPAGSREAAAVLEEIRLRARALLSADNWTPETLAAAYARVSRDPRGIPELRAIARAEVDKARRSNETIIFGLGHASVAEHAVFNLDILGLSRMAVEVLEHQRLASYTEKSQRYILLDEDWILPEELRGTPGEAPFRQAMDAQVRFYKDAHARLLSLFEQSVPEDQRKDKATRRRLEGMAKEDARYALSLATTVQLGQTINARGLERLISRCRAHPLQEVRELAEEAARAVAGMAPSLVKYIEPSEFQRRAAADLREAIGSLGEPSRRIEAAPLADAAPLAGAVSRAAPLASAAPLAGASHLAGAAQATHPEEDTEAGSVRLVASTPEADLALLSALLFSAGTGSVEVCRRRAGALDPKAARQLAAVALRNLGPHDPMRREFEQVDLVFEVVLSASAFAQLKRHRMASILTQDYDPGLGATIPASFHGAGLVPAFRELLAATSACWNDLRTTSPEAAPYVLCNAHRRRVLFKCNARELHHVARLREDAHAQWDIRAIASRMLEQARAVMPLTLLLACGKDRFDETRGRLFS